jgi:type IV secretion system protein VirD4
MTKQFFKVVTWPFRVGLSFIASLAPLFGMPRPFFMLFVGLALPIIFIAGLAQLWLNGRMVLIAIGSLFVLAVLFDMSRHLIKPRIRKDTYGTAHFATPQEIKALLTSPNDTTRLLIGSYGRWRSVGLTYRQQESHVLLCAPTGKGKTSSIILPGLLREDGMRNLVINDVKGELVSKTLGALQQHYTCCLFSPTRVTESHRYNPLCHVHSMEDAEDLARCIVENTGTSAEPFWDNAARLLLTATILHLHTSEPQAPLSRITDLLCGMGLDEIVQEMMKSPSQLARDVAVSFMASLSNNPKLAGSILADMASRLFLLRNPSIVTVTSSDEFDFENMMEKPTAIFLCIPASDSQRLKWLSAAFFMQLMAFLTKRAEHSSDRRLPRPMAFYLDEFANIGVIPHFLQHISLVRSAGIAFLLATQNFGQLHATYGNEGLETILANTNTHVMFSGCGQVETDYYSRRIGQTTVPSVSLSHQHTLDLDPKATESMTSCPLIYPDQLRTMKADHLVVLSENLPPVRVKAKPYFKEAHLKKLVNLPPVLPSRPVNTAVMDQVSIAGIQEEEDKQTLERENQTKLMKKEPLDDFFLP